MLDLSIFISLVAAVLFAFNGNTILAIISGLVCFSLASTKAKQIKDKQPIQDKELKQDVADDGYQEFMTILSKSRESHPNAYYAIMSLAASDGAVSKQEMRVAIGLFSRLGIDIGNRTEMLISKHTTRFSYSLPVSSLESRIEGLTQLPEETRRAILAASDAIVACTMKTSRTKATLHERIQSACRGRSE